MFTGNQHMKRMLKTLSMISAILPAMSAGAAVPTRPVLTTPVLLRLAQVAIDQCAKDGFNVAVAILDRDGNLRLHILTPDVSLFSGELSKRKARTSAMFRVPSIVIAERMKTSPNFLVSAMAIDPNLAAAQGGLPIFAGDELLGAIGISGAPSGDKDEVCAQAGLDAIAPILR